MKIVAFETSATPGALALLEGDAIVYEKSLPEKRRTSETFAGQLQDALRQFSWQPRDVQLFAVCRGPGSFTGLRIGVMAAKTFAYVTGCRLVAVDTLELIAYQAAVDGQPVWSLLDAQRQQLFAARYRLQQGDVIEQVPTQVLDAREFLAARQAGERLTGSGLSKWQGAIPPAVVTTPADLWQPRAGILGQLARRHCLSGRIADVWSLKPQYYRPSAAEEKLSFPA